MADRNANWWERRTFTEKAIIFMILIAAVLLIYRIIFIILHTTREEEYPEEFSNFITPYVIKKAPILANLTYGLRKLSAYYGWSTKFKEGFNRQVCIEPSCIEAADMVMHKMKQDVNPCDDFYQFACGKFMEEEVTQDGRGLITVYSLTQDLVTERLKMSVSQIYNKSDLMHLRLPNALYTACMNETLIENLGNTPITNVTELLGGWPVLKGDAWNTEGTWTWQESIKTLRQLGFDTNFVFSVKVLPYGKEHKIYIDQPVFGVARNSLINGFNDPSVSAYLAYMVDMAVLFGARKEEAKIELRQSLQFEMNLANISWMLKERQNKTLMYKELSIKELQEMYPYIQWLDYFNALLKDIKIEEDEIVVVVVPSFFEGLGNVLNTNSNRDIANYLLWLVHFRSARFLPQAIRNRDLEYITAIWGPQMERLRWKECLDITTNSLKPAVGSLYVHDHLNETWREEVLKMTTRIREYFKYFLKKVKWMAPITRKGAIDKLKAIKPYVGYPDDVFNNEILEEYYENLEINSSKYFESYWKLKVLEQNNMFSRLHSTRIHKNRWVYYSNVARVHAHYRESENSIFIPAAMLNGYFFEPHRPKYMNYGSIGVIIGRMLTHSLQFPDNDCWWQPESKRTYRDKVKCFVEQYGNYKDKMAGLQLNEANTQFEYIADNNGIRVSYLAYKEWLSKNGPEVQLIGLNYTAEQMFWISAAQSCCAKYKPAILKNHILNNLHSLGNIRVLGVFSNTQEFSKDFNCPKASPMNPDHKCELF